MSTDLENAIAKLRRFGYSVEEAPYASVSSDGYMMSYLVGGGLASNYDIMAISDGLEHLPTGADFEVGQAVQFVLPLPGGDIPAGAVAIVEEVWPNEIKVRRGNKLGRVDPSAIKHFPQPDRKKRR